MLRVSAGFGCQVSLLSEVGRGVVHLAIPLLDTPQLTASSGFLRGGDGGGP